jgi:ABC-type multidrug transport system fused ATPase/permease subunit
MNRIIQLILAIVIARYMVGLVMILVYFPAHFKNFSKTYDNPGGVLNYEMAVTLWDLELTRQFYYDSASSKNVRKTYAGLKFIDQASTLRNDTPLVKTIKGDWIAAKQGGDPKHLQIPITSERYIQLLWASMAFLIILLVLLIYISVVLFRFAAKTGKKEFFSRENRKRLRIFGTFLILSSFANYLINTYQVWFLEQITGTLIGNADPLTSGYEKLAFPYVLVSGLFMFIIAEAFSKGQQLQTEQEYTI